jgi:hypothetical protein
MSRSKVLAVTRLGAVLLVLLAMISFVRVSGVSAQDDELTIDLNELNDSGISGTATLTDNGDGTTTVSIAVDGATGDHPVHIHSGTCDDLDPNPTYPLNDVNADGESETDIDVALADLLAEPYAVNLHESATNLGTYVACGEIVAADAGDDTADDTADDTGDDTADDTGDDEGVGGEVTTAPTTGVGTMSSNGGSMLLATGLALAGLTFLAGGYALRRRENER